MSVVNENGIVLDAALPAAISAPLVLPTTDAFGNTLTGQQQFDLMLQNPTWVQQATTPGTVAYQQYAEIQARMLADLETANPLAVAPATDGEAFYIPWPADATPDQLALDGPIRNWLVAAEADARSGSSLAESANELARKAERWSEADFTRHENESRAVLQQIHGDQLGAKLDSVADMIGEIEAKHPELRQFLDARPWLLRDSIIVNQLINISEARASRRG